MTIKTITCGVLAVIATSVAMPVFAQQESDVAIFEEITVLATKREQTLQEVPVAVAVVSADVMNEAQVLDIKDLQFLVPSLRVSQLQSSANATFLIRGFGNGANNAGVEPSVGVFVDGVYRSRSAASLADFPNLERIEVIKGPQSTLFGKNASAGVINVVTAKPSLDGYSGSAALTYGDYDQVIVKGDITGPLSETFGWSLSGNYNQRDGYFTNLETGTDFNELNRYGVRGQLLWAPSDTFEARFIADYDKIDENCCGVANLAEGVSALGIRSPGVGGDYIAEQPFSYTGLFNFDAVNEIENSGVSLQLDWDLNDAVTLTSITALRKLERFDNSDGDFTTAALLNETAANLTDTTLDTFTQEFRLSGSTDRTDWLVGAFYFNEDVEQNSGVLFGSGARPYVDTMTKLLVAETQQDFIDALNPAIPSPLTQLEGLIASSYLPGSPLPPLAPDVIDQFGPIIPGQTFLANGQGTIETGLLDNQALSLFAQVDFALTDRATVTLGINYTEDEKDVSVTTVNDNVFSYIDLENDIGEPVIFATVLGQLLQAGQCPLGPTDPTCLAQAQGAAQLGKGVSCADVPDGVPCNPVLDLQAVQILPPFANFPNSVEPGTSKDDQTTWTARLAYDLTDQLNAYVSAGTGFKATSWNLSRDSLPFDAQTLIDAGLGVPNLQSGTRFAGPEDSTLYEIGLKGAFDTWSFNLAIFDQEIEGFQENVFQGTGFVLVNAGKQSTTGVELDVLWSLTENLEWYVSTTFLDPVYDDYQNAPGVGGPTDLSGTKVPGVSELSANTWVRWMFDLGSTTTGFVRAEYYYEDETQVISNVPADIASREVSMVNASIGLQWENGFELMLWGRNLTDDEYLQSAFPTTFQNLAEPFSYSGYPNQPRTWGITLRKYFD